MYRKIFVGSIIAMLLVAGFLNIAGTMVGATDNNPSEPMENSPLSDPMPRNITKANVYKDSGFGLQSRFTIVWVTDGEFTGTLSYSTTSGFDPATGDQTTDARSGGDPNYVDDTHYVDVKKQSDHVYIYYYIESNGVFYGDDGVGGTKPYNEGGTNWSIYTSGHVGAGAGAYPPQCGHLLYEGQTPPDGANYEIAIGWYHDNGSHGGDPAYPIADITDYNRAMVEGTSGAPDNRDGGYLFDSMWILKTQDDSAEWEPVPGDWIHAEGFGTGLGHGSQDYTIQHAKEDGYVEIIPDITLETPNQAPVTSFTVEPTNKPCGEPAVWDTVYFNSTSTDDKNSSDDLYYKWDFGDGSAIEEGYGRDGYNNRTHIYYASAIYTVTLNVTDNSTPSLSSDTSQAVNIWPNRVSTTPLDVRETNVKNVAGKISWHTCIDTTGYVIWGDTPGDLGNTSTDTRGDETYSDDTHACDITGLTEYNTYYYKIKSGGKTYDDFGAAFSFTTGKAFTSTPWGNVQGYVYKSDGTTPAEGVIVYMTLRLDADGTTSLPEAVLTDSIGYYKYDRGNFRTQDGETQFDYTPLTDYCDKVAEGATEGTADQTVILTSKDTGEAQMDPDMILSGTPADTTKPTSTASSPSEIGAATWNVDYTAEDGCASGLDYVELWYSYEGGAWTLNQTDDYTGQVSVSSYFSFTAGDGYGNYSFYTRAMDIDGNYEPAPSEPDSTTWYKYIPNNPPTCSITDIKPLTKKEGSTIYFNGTGNDTDGNVTDYQWDFGDGNTTGKKSISLPAGDVVLPMETHVYGDNDTYTVTLTVWDDVGDTGTNTTSITVNNVPPTITSAAHEPEPSDEGSTVWFNATATDPGSDDILTYTWNFGDGSPTETGPQVTHVYVQNDSYSWSLLVEDDDGENDTASGIHTVDNVAPTITSMTDDPSSTNPSETVWFNSTATDPGASDILTYTWDFGDGTPTAAGQQVTHIYSSAATYTYTLTVDDGDGGTDTLSDTHLVSPWDVDYIVIEDTLGGTGSSIPDKTVDVGYTIQGWAAAYNSTIGYIADISVTWTVANADGAEASTSPTSGDNSTFNSGAKGGNATWTADDGDGHTDVVNFTINAPKVDEIVIIDAAGDAISDQTISVGTTIQGWAAGHNDTIGYIGNVSVTWNVINTTSNAWTDPTTGDNSTFNAGIAEGTAIWYANYSLTIFNYTVFDIIIPQVDKIVIESAASNAGTEIPAQTVDVGYTIQGWAAGYNTTLDIYLNDVSVTWSVVNAGGAEASTLPLTGASSTFDSGLAGGTATWTATYGLFTDTVEFTINAPTVDSIVIEDTADVDGTAIPDQTVDVGFTIIGYAASYNSTAGYIGDVSAAWTVTNASGAEAFTSPLTGLSSTFNASLAGGTATWTATFGTFTDIVAFTINPPTVDSIVIEDTADVAGTAIPDQTVDVSFTIMGYAASYNDTAGYIGDVSVTWSVANADGAEASTSPLTGLSSTFDSGLAGGTATWTATFGTFTDTVEFTIIPTAAPTVDYIVIEYLNGTEIGDVSMSADETLDCYARGYNTTSGLIGNVSVSWSLTGTIGTISPITGNMTTFDATTIGTGTISADDGSGHTDDTGTITVTYGAVHHIRIESSGGTAIVDSTIDVGDTIVMYSRGYDADGNLIGDVSAAWTSSNTSVGTVSPASGTSSTFTGVSDGTCTVTANDSAGHTDTVTFTVEAVVTIGTISGTITDSDGNPIEGAAVTAYDADGTVAGTTTTDADGNYEIELEQGTYDIKVEKSGYEIKWENDVSVTAGQTTTADLTLPLKTDILGDYWWLILVIIIVIIIIIAVMILKKKGTPAEAEEAEEAEEETEETEEAEGTEEESGGTEQ